MEAVRKLASQRAVVILSKSSCCLCHTIKTLFKDLGCAAAVCELDEESSGKEMEKALVKLLGRSNAVPAVFIDGKFVGSTDHVMDLHLSGNLVPLLKQAGALWL